MKRWLVVAACLSVFALYVATQFALKQPADPQSINVFGSFWESGRAAWAGGNPYAPGTFTIEWQAGPYTFVERNLNPPSTLPIFQVLALSDVYTAARSWLLLSVLLFLIPALWISRTANLYQIPWLFLLSIDTISIGQIYTPLFTLSALAWVALQRNKHIVAGIAIGFIVSAKPNFAVWPALLLFAGHWRSATTAGITTGALFAIPALLYGGDIYPQWFAAIRSDNHGLFPVDVSLIGFFNRAGIEPLGYVLAVVLLILAAATSWRTRANSQAVSTLAMPIALLSAPLAWPHYMLIAAPSLFWRPWNTRIIAAALLLLVPMQLNFATVGTALATPAGLLYILPILLLAWDGFLRCRTEKGPPESVQTAHSQQYEPAIDRRSTASLLAKSVRKVGSYGLVSGFCYALNNVMLIGLDLLGLPLWMNLAVTTLVAIAIGYTLLAAFVFRASMRWGGIGRYSLILLANMPIAYVLLWLLSDLPMHLAAPLVTTAMVAWNAIGSSWAIRRRRAMAEV